MNKRQKIVQQQFINNEEAVIKRLKQVYNQSNKDITGKIASLDSSISALQKALADVGEDGIGELAAAFLKNAGNLTPEEAKATLQSMLQSKVYQKKYQEALKKQVGDILDKMQSEEFKTVDEYLQKCYEEGFIGTIYDLQGQGIPMCFPMDQEAMVRAVQLDSKISQGLYSRLGEDVAMLKKKITAQVSRGIATGMTFHQVAQQLAGYTNIGFNNAVRIARTEGHRTQCQSGMDACHKAKEKGADVVKQWDATLDGKTRDSHAAVDGEVKELDEKFSNGLMFPGDSSGAAAEVINCRCALLQRARWAVGGSFTKMNNFTKQLETFESPEAYEEFKKGFFSAENKKYMNYVQQMEEKYKTRDFAKVLDSMTDREYKHYSKLLENNPTFNKKASKTVENSGKSGTIELGGLHRNKGADYVEPMPKKQLQKIVKGFKRNGGTIQMNDATDAYLKSKNAEGITLNADTILLKQHSGRAAVFEELIHATQYKNGANDGSYVSRLLNEIAAQEKLLKYQKAYRLTSAEVKQTQKALKDYKKELEDYQKGSG